MEDNDLFPEPELLEHIVDIDKFMEVRLKIPKRLNALELKALMSKANKMFNLADVPIVAEHTTIQPLKNVGGRPRTWMRVWNDKIELDLARLRIDGFTAPEIAQFLNEKYNLHLSKGRINSKVYDLKHKDKKWGKLLMKAREMPRISKTGKPAVTEESIQPSGKRPYIHWKQEWIDDIMMLRNTGITYRLVTQKINEKYNLQLKTKQVEKKAWVIKTKGLWNPDSNVVARVQEIKSKEEEDKQVKQFGWQVFTDEMKEEVAFLYKLGYSYQQISDKVSVKFGKDITFDQVRDKLAHLRKSGAIQKRNVDIKPIEEKKQGRYNVRRTKEEIEERYSQAYKLYKEKGLAFTSALRDVFGYRVGGEIQKKFKDWCNENNLPFELMSKEEVVKIAQQKAQEKLHRENPDRFKKPTRKGKNMVWEEKYVSQIVEQFDIGKSSKEIRDYLLERFNLRVTHKQVIDKIYLLKKQGVIKNG